MDDAPQTRGVRPRRVVRRGSSPRRRSRSSASRPRRPDPALQRRVRARDRVPREEVLGRDARDFVIPPEERDAFGEFLAYVWKTGAPSPQVGHWRTKAGGRRLIAWSNKPMVGADGAPVVAGHDRHRPDRPRAARDEDDRALEGDPEAKLAEVSRLASEQRALRRVATLVAAEVSPERVFTAVSEECARVLQVNSSAVLRYEGDETATIVGRHNRDSIDVFRVGERLPADESSAIGRVLRTGAPARIDDWGGVAAARSPRRSSASATDRRPPRRSSSPGALWGAVAIASEDPLPPESEDRLGAFCELVSLAVASAQARADLIASRARARRGGRRAAAQARAQPPRRRPAAPRLRRAQAARRASAARARTRRARRELLDEARASSAPGSRSCARSRAACIPRSSAEHGLRRALEALAERLPVASSIDVPTERLPEHIEATAYYIVSEALTNVAKHAEARRARGRRPARRRRRCAARSPTTAAAAPTRRAAPASSGCATAPRPPAGRSRSSARPAAERSSRRRCR